MRDRNGTDAQRSDPRDIKKRRHRPIPALVPWKPRRGQGQAVWDEASEDRRQCEEHEVCG